MELVGTDVKDAILLPSSSNLWGTIISSGCHLDDVIDDTENGGLGIPLQMSDMGDTSPPNAEISSSEFQSFGNGVPVIQIDGAYQALSTRNSQLLHGAAGQVGPIVDASKAIQSSTITAGITFDNNTYEGHPEPSDTAGDSYVSATDLNGAVVQYAVVGGGSTRQTTLTATTSGSAVWSMPGEGSSNKDFIVNLAAYLNSTGASQTITYPVAFRVNPASVQTLTGSCTGITTNATTLTFPNTMGASALTGLCEVRGY